MTIYLVYVHCALSGVYIDWDALVEDMRALQERGLTPIENVHIQRWDGNSTMPCSWLQTGKDFMKELEI